MLAIPDCVLSYEINEMRANKSWRYREINLLILPFGSGVGGAVSVTEKLFYVSENASMIRTSGVTCD